MIPNDKDALSQDNVIRLKAFYFQFNVINSGMEAQSEIR